MPEFMPGLKLCELFYEEAVRPILAQRFPGLRYSAARIGGGSDVLGFDTEMSMDHDWGPRLQLFLDDEDFARLASAIHERLGRELPAEFLGFATAYALNDDGTHRMGHSASGRVDHQIRLTTVSRFISETLGFDLRADITPADWLTFPAQKLLEITAGAVFHDGIGLRAVRERFAYYPRDVWLYLMAAAWNRIGQEEHLMGRAGFVGDEIGSALIGGRLVRDIMRLCFLMERRYAPYPKWFGTAFRRLACADQLEPLLLDALHAHSWQARESALVETYAIVAAMQNARGLTGPRPATVAPFFNRPFRVIHLESDFADALRRAIRDPAVKKLASCRLIGGIDLISDNTDLLCEVEYRPALRRLYEPEST